MSEDPFGLQREQRILRSGVRDVFTPHRPINSIDLFFGRQPQVQKIIESLTTPGQHAVLFGDRGVGKSSLANVASQLLLKKLMAGRLVFIRCDGTTTFASVSSEILARYGEPRRARTRTTVKTEEMKASANVVVAKGGLSSSTSESETTHEPPARVSPALVAETLGKRQGLIVIDEFDAIRTSADRRSVAELLKQLSDANAPSKVLVVGIAASCEQLLVGHPSLQRCLRQVHLGRMSNREIKQIITEGGKKIHVSFDGEIADHIVRLSSGYPYFTQLLALKCAETAIGENRTRVTATDFPVALHSAVEDAEETLRHRYQEAVRSAGTDMYRVVVEEAARIEETEFRAHELRRAIGSRIGQVIRQNDLNNYLQRLVSQDGSTILMRVSKGVYRFSDPRMRSYVRIVELGQTMAATGSTQ